MLWHNNLLEVCYKILHIQTRVCVRVCARANELEKCFSIYSYFPHLSRTKAESPSEAEAETKEEAPLEYVYSVVMQATSTSQSSLVAINN